MFQPRMIHPVELARALHSTNPEAQEEAFRHIASCPGCWKCVRSLSEVFEERLKNNPPLSLATTERQLALKI